MAEEAYSSQALLLLPAGLVAGPLTIHRALPHAVFPHLPVLMDRPRLTHLISLGLQYIDTIGDLYIYQLCLHWGYSPCMYTPRLMLFGFSFFGSHCFLFPTHFGDLAPL